MSVSHRYAESVAAVKNETVNQLRKLGEHITNDCCAVFQLASKYSRINATKWGLFDHKLGVANRFIVDLLKITSFLSNIDIAAVG